MSGPARETGGRVNNCRRNGPELCWPLSKSDKINHASRGHARFAASLSRSPARDIPAASRWISVAKRRRPSGNQRKMHCNSRRCPFPATSSSSALFTQPLATVARVRASSRLSLVFRRSNTRRIGSTGSTSDDGEDGERGIRVSAEEANASRRNASAPSVKLSFSHNSLESLLLNLVIGSECRTYGEKKQRRLILSSHPDSESILLLG